MADLFPNYETDIALPKRRANIAVTPLHWVEYAAFRFAMAGLRLAGIDRASGFTGGLLRFLGPKLRKVSARAEDNLRMIFPDWSDEKIAATIKAVWENVGRTAGEYAHLDKINVIGEAPRISCTGDDNVIRIVKEYGRAIFISGHFGNWEVPGIVARQLQLRFGVVYRALNNPLIDEDIIARRAAVATRRQIPKGLAGARPMIDLLRDGKSIAFLNDQKLTLGGIPVPFMGHIAMTSPVAARLAIRNQIPVVPIYAKRTTGAHFEVTVEDPIDFTPGGDLTKDVEALTIKINERLEAQVREDPAQWLWLHRRWLIRPEDQGVSAHMPS